MTRSNYQPVFKLSVSHSYFERNICKCLRFIPGAATQTFIKRFGLAKNDFVNGFSFYYNSTTALPDFLNYLGTVTGCNYFDFDIETTESSFDFFTQLPSNWLGSITYDSQDSANTISNSIVQLNPVLSSGINTKNIGTLTVHFSDIIGQPPGERLQFSINYTARATQWQYFVINRSALDLNAPAIAGKIPVSFDGPQNVTIENGQQALLFTSGDTLLPLSEVPRYKFDLVTSSGFNRSTTKTIFKGLPNPSPSRIGSIVTRGDNQAISPMYIYI